jgi:hypothetical protein
LEERLPGQDMMPPPNTLEELMASKEETLTNNEMLAVMRQRVEELDKLRKAEPKGTAVDGPEHYNGYQVLEAICDAGLGRGFCLGNAVKYILRAEKKGSDKQDLEKAQFYLSWYLEHFYDDSEDEDANA